MATDRRAEDDAVRLHHELRNSAAVVAGFASLVAEEALESPLPVAQAHLGRLLANVAQMQEIITAWHGSSDRSDPGNATPMGREPTPSTTARRLLVVEGDDDHFEMIRSLLLRPGHSGHWDVLHARTLSEACRILVEAQPACSLVNLTLPDAGPLEAVVTMRNLSPDHPIVVLTGYAQSGVGVEAVRNGAQDYLVKGSVSSEVLQRSVVYAIERSRIEAELTRQALHDALTGLPNRVLLMDRLRLALARLDRTETYVAVLFIDLDRFKLVNDTMGHHVGDQVIVDVAARLRHFVPRADTVARFGGDEFVVLVEGVHDETEATALADALLGTFAEPFACSGDELRLHASLGIALADSADVNAETLLANADAAMYRAKESGRAHAELFDDSMRSRLVTRVEIERALSTAIAGDELALYYQPLVGVRDGRVAGAEVLLRWHHPDGRFLTPGDFLGIAEDSGQIVAIGAWVLEQACIRARAWHDSGLIGDSWTTWVNVSSRQLDRPGLLDDVAHALAVSGLRPFALGLEITEGALIQDSVLAAGLVEPLHRLGVKIAIDDFGTGFSSLRRLRDLPIDHLKIDGSFVRGLDRHAEDATIVTGCVQLARALGLSSVAEAVETPRQLELLREMGCDLVQGFALARPMPAAALEPLLRAATDGVLPGPTPAPPRPRTHSEAAEAVR